MKKNILYLVFIFSGMLYSQNHMESITNIKSKNYKNKIKTESFYKADASRIETNTPYEENGNKKNIKTIIITRLDKKVIWTLMPEQKSYCEIKFDDLKKYYDKDKEDIIMNKYSDMSDFKLKKIGSGEKIAGIKTEKYEYNTKKLKGEAWLSSENISSDIDNFFKNMAKAFPSKKTNKKELQGKILLKNNGKEENMEFSYIVKKISNKNTSFDLPADYKLVDIKYWENLKEKLDVKILMKKAAQAIKEEVKSKAKEEAKNKAKEEGKKALKNLIKF